MGPWGRRLVRSLKRGQLRLECTSKQLLFDATYSLEVGRSCSYLSVHCWQTRACHKKLENADFAGHRWNPVVSKSPLSQKGPEMDSARAECSRALQQHGQSQILCPGRRERWRKATRSGVRTPKVVFFWYLKSYFLGRLWGERGPTRRSSR